MDSVLEQVIGIFAEEVKEQVGKIAAALLAMESDPASVKVHIEELLRQAHSLKGSSASLGQADLEHLAHSLEEVLMPVRRGRGTLTPRLVDAALRAVDAARLRVDGLLADTPQGTAEVEQWATELLRLATEGEGVTKEGSHPGGESSVERSFEAQNPVAAVAPSASTPTGGDDVDSLRVASTRLQALERRLDELRLTRGRLDQRVATTSLIIETLNRLSHEARLVRTSAVSGDAVDQLLRQVSALKRDLFDDAELAQANAVELDENLRAIRMVGAEQVQEPVARAIRDAGRRTGKDVQLEFLGGETRIDRRLLEELKSPLLHLVRNAVDHGVEGAEIREATGKPARAKVTVRFEQRGREVLVEVGDDGRGIDGVKVRAKAVERGLLTADKAEQLTESEVHELLFRADFSTSERVTELSGRGVGLDVVRAALNRLHGRVKLVSQLGNGTTFQLWVPLTLAASEAMVIEENGRPFALPLANIQRIVRAKVSELRTSEGRAFFHLDGQPMPVVAFARLFGMTQRYEGAAHRTLVIVQGATHPVALVCERLLGSRTLVLQSFPSELSSIKLLSAVAALPNGQALFVLSPNELVHAAMEIHRGGALRTRPQDGPGTVLVADDSITTRSLLRTALEAFGFRVSTAADGDEALRLAFSQSFDVVVSDVRMPRLDGFALTSRLRADPRTTHLPVVLFSSLDSDEDKQRGSASGANAYLTKGAFDRGQLLEVVADLARRS